MKKKKRETKSDHARIETQPETDVSGEQRQNMDYWRLDDKQSHDAPKKRRKKKKRNAEIADPMNGVSTLDIKIVNECNKFAGSCADGCPPEKRKKRKQKHSLLREAQSEESNERVTDSQEELQNSKGGGPISFGTEFQPRKCKKKRKHKGPKQPPLRTLVALEHESDSLLLPVLESTRQTSDDASHKQRKQQRREGHSSQILGKKTADCEAKRIKRKRKAEKGSNALNDGKYSMAPGDTTPENTEHTKKKKKTKKRSIDSSQAIEFSETNIPYSDVPSTTLEGAYKSKKRKQQRSSCSQDGNRDAVSTQASQMRTRQEIVDDSQEKSRRLKSDCSTSAVSSKSPPPVLLSTEDMDLSAEGECAEAAHSKTHTSRYELQHILDAASEDLKTLAAKKATSGPVWFLDQNAGSSDTEEEDRAWMNDLPFTLEDYCSLHSAIPKQGAVIKRGKWDGLEDNILKANVEKFCKQYNIKDVMEVIRPHLYEEKKQIMRFLRRHKFHFRICRGLKRMPFYVYIRIRKICDVRNYKGIFTKEEIAAIKKLKLVHGHRWSEIGRWMERSGQSVQDWYRNRYHQDGRRHGKWSAREKQQLSRAVKDVTGADEENFIDCLVGIPWREVAPRVPTRSRTQCMAQWKYILCWSVGGRTRHDWTSEDSVHLIESVYALDVIEEFEIDWVNMHQTFWERASSPAMLTRKWHILKVKYLKNYHFMTFEEILDELYHNALPILKESVARQQALQAKIKSKEVISDTEDSCSDSEWY